MHYHFLRCYKILRLIIVPSNEFVLLSIASNSALLSLNTALVVIAATIMVIISDTSNSNHSLIVELAISFNVIHNYAVWKIC